MPDFTRYLVIEDELPIRRFLKASLPAEEAEWIEAGSGEEGIRLVANRNPDIVLLDLGLPDMDGLTVVARLREWTNVPIIVISARGQERDKVAALDAGADDYLTKPFAIGELLARTRVALRHSRRANAFEEARFESEGLIIDFSLRTVTRDGNEIRLTQIEFKLLTLLARHVGKVLTQRQLIVEVWGSAFEDSSHTLRVHMANLRQKIERNPSQPRYIRTETGVGYRMISR